MIGAEVLALALKHQQTRVVFGVVGIPVIEVAECIRMLEVPFIATRNEQAATYAANAWGYLNAQPGVALVVSGPGFVHALAGILPLLMRSIDLNTLFRVGECTGERMADGLNWRIERYALRQHGRVSRTPAS